MEISSVYTKQRKEFGLRRTVQKLEPQVLLEIMPNPADLQNFTEAPRQDRSSSHVQFLSEHNFNTVTVELKTSEAQSRSQTEDAEQTLRLRKKIEREANFTSTVMKSVTISSPALLLNNAQNPTSEYFKPKKTLQNTSETCRILATFKDPEIVKRQVSQVVFMPEQNKNPRKFAVCYSQNLSQMELNTLESKLSNQKLTVSNNAYIFDISNSNEPEFTLNSQFPISCLKFSQKDQHIILCGLQTGVVAMYDLRKGSYPISVSEIQFSHKSEVSELKIMKSKSGSEFATVGADGQILFWDYRNMQKPVENYVMNFENDEQLQYPLCSLNLDMKVLAGSQSGHIFNINKKTKTIDQLLAHHGAVKQIQRHFFHQKFFATCGDWCVKFFADDCRTPLISFVSDSQYVDLQLSQTRPAVFAAIRRNGFLDVYDMFRSLSGPSVQIQIFNTSEANCMDFDVSGRFIVVGGNDGVCCVCQLSDGLVQGVNPAQERYEKQWVNLLFERESKREKTLEMRSKQGNKVKKEEIQEIEIANEGEILQGVIEEYDRLLGE
ncbi:Dynein intermediate chain [Spironucleus salmonicida]|uniref:Dynein intermediate chain n=1 Tax=Spironucleus salmonicida TaxID=348837 RepID=V6LHR7_9EUKA|nr:Dynein intermediate chain [Spironucleus salmonicida]|eukprot:EST44097.1 Dynein intermediate chain [Spironucleus salmonicida]